MPGIVIQITGDGAGAAEALRVIEERMKQTATRGTEMSETLAHAGEKIKSAFELMGIGVGLTAMADKFRDLLKEVTQTAMELHHLAEQTGISTENLSVLKYVSDSTGVGMEGLSKAFKKLSTNLYEIQQGSDKPLKAFASIGISQKQLAATGGDLFKVMGLLADRFQSMPDGFEKNAVATKLLGKAGQELIPVLNEGSEAVREYQERAEKLGIVFDSAAVDKAKKLHQAFVDLKASAEGAGLGIMQHLAPALEYLAKEIPDVIGVGGGKHGQDFAGGLEAINEWADNFVHAIGRVGYALAMLPASQMGATIPDFDKLFPGDRSKYRGFLSGAQGTRDMLAAMNSVTAPPPDKGDGGLGGEPGTPWWVTNIHNWLEGIRKDADETTKSINDFVGKVVGTYEWNQETNPTLRNANLAGKLGEDNPNVQWMPGRPEELPSAPMSEEDYAKDEERQQRAYEAAYTVASFMDQIAEMSARGKFSFRSLVDSMISDMSRFAIKVLEQKALIPIMESLFGLGGTRFNSAGYAVNDTGHTYAGLMAGGGDLSSNDFAIVGEKGPELFAPGTSGSIIPNDVVKGMAQSGGGSRGASPSVTINNVNNSSQAVEMKQAGVSFDEDARQFIIHTVLEDAAGGGPLSRAIGRG